MSIVANRYTCVVRWKAGERAALANLAGANPVALVPLIEPTPMAFSKAKTSDAFRAQIRKTVASVGQSWGTRPAFIDDHLIASIREAGRVRPLVILLHEVHSYGLNVAPILRLGDSAETVRAVLASQPSESPVGLRIVPSHEVSVGRILSVLTSWGLSPSRVHLFVDQVVVDSVESPARQLMRLPLMLGWQGVTLLGGSFPADLSDLEPDVHVLPRMEWLRFLLLLTEWPATMPRIGFGDYGTIHAQFQEPKPGCRPSASVRYALDDSWLVLRGYSVSNKEAGGFEQFRGHAMYLMGHPDFRGRTFSYGDRYIAGRCAPGATTGNLTTWLAASMNHHIATTCANLGALTAERVAEIAAARRQRAEGARGLISPVSGIHVRPMQP